MNHSLMRIIIYYHSWWLSWSVTEYADHNRDSAAFFKERMQTRCGFAKQISLLQNFSCWKFAIFCIALHCSQTEVSNVRAMQEDRTTALWSSKLNCALAHFWLVHWCAFCILVECNCKMLWLQSTLHKALSNRTTQTVCFGLSLVSHSRGYVGTLWPPPPHLPFLFLPPLAPPPLSISPPPCSTCSEHNGLLLLRLPPADGAGAPGAWHPAILSPSQPNPSCAL